MNRTSRSACIAGAIALLAQGAVWAAVDTKSRQAAAAAEARAVAPAMANALKAPPAAPASTEIQLPPMSAEDIVKRNVAARGGLVAWQKVQTMSLRGKLDAGQKRRDGGNIGLTKQDARALVKAKLASAASAPAADVIQLPFALDLQRPNKTRLEIPFRGDTALQVYDGKQGWKLRPYLGRHEVEAYTADELKIAASEQQLDGPLINHAAKGIAVAVDGGERVEGRKAYRLRLTLPGGEQRRLWVDAENFLDLKIEGAPRRFDGKMRSVATYFKDYRPVDGLQVARLLETRVEGTQQSERIIVEQVALNAVVDASRFAKPQ